MKALEWMRFFLDQRQRHGKRLFTVTELANVADAAPATMNVELGRLVGQGVIRRWVAGRYGLPEGVTAADLAAAIDSQAYVTGAYALEHHGLITQQPREIDCFSLRRHNRSRQRPTELGKLVFVCVNRRLHSLPEAGGLASPEQAFCDLHFLLRRRGLDPRSLYTFRKLDRLMIPPELLARYPLTVGRAVATMLQERRPRGPATRIKPAG